jgi:hypothetical protein
VQALLQRAAGHLTAVVSPNLLAAAAPGGAPSAVSEAALVPRPGAYQSAGCSAWAARLESCVHPRCISVLPPPGAAQPCSGFPQRMSAPWLALAARTS